MTSEARVVRPFVGLHDVQQVFSESMVYVGEEPIAPGETLTINSESFRRQPVKLVLCPREEAFEHWRRGLLDGLVEATLEPADVEFVVLTSTKYLKMVDIVFRLSVDRLEELTRVVDLVRAGRPRALHAARGGCDIDVTVILTRTLEPQPLKAWRKGTWLARTRYRVSSELGQLGFTPRPLTQEVRDDKGLPADTIRYVELEAEVVFDADPQPDDLSVYIDETVLARMSASPGSTAATVFQQQVFLDAVSAIVRVALLQWDELEHETIDTLEGTLLRRLVDLAAGVQQGEGDRARHHRREAMLDLLRRSPDRFLAVVEAQVGIKKNIDELMGV
jgi:hypothetical protein